MTSSLQDCLEFDEDNDDVIVTAVVSDQQHNQYLDLAKDLLNQCGRWATERQDEFAARRLQDLANKLPGCRRLE